MGVDEYSTLFFAATFPGCLPCQNPRAWVLRIRSRGVESLSLGWQSRLLLTSNPANTFGAQGRPPPPERVPRLIEGTCSCRVTEQEASGPVLPRGGFPWWHIRSPQPRVGGSAQGVALSHGSTCSTCDFSSAPSCGATNYLVWTCTWQQPGPGTASTQCVRNWIPEHLTPVLASGEPSTTNFCLEPSLGFHDGKSCCWWWIWGATGPYTLSSCVGSSCWLKPPTARLQPHGASLTRACGTGILPSPCSVCGCCPLQPEETKRERSEGGWVEAGAPTPWNAPGRRASGLWVPEHDVGKATPFQIQNLRWLHPQSTMIHWFTLAQQKELWSSGKGRGKQRYQSRLSDLLENRSWWGFWTKEVLQIFSHLLRDLTSQFHAANLP